MKTAIKIELLPQQYEELATVARNRRMSVEEIAYEAIRNGCASRPRSNALAP